MAGRLEAQKVKAALAPQADDDPEIDDDYCCLCLTEDLMECLFFHLYTCFAHVRERGTHYKKVSRDDDGDADIAEPAGVYSQELEMSPIRAAPSAAPVS